MFQAPKQGLTQATDDAGSIRNQAALIVRDPFHEGGLRCPKNGLVEEDDIQNPGQPSKASAA